MHLLLSGRHTKTEVNRKEVKQVTALPPPGLRTPSSTTVTDSEHVGFYSHIYAGKFSSTHSEPCTFGENGRVKFIPM